MKFYRAIALYFSLSLLLGTKGFSMGVDTTKIWWHKRKSDNQTTNTATENPNVEGAQIRSTQWAYNYFDDDFVQKIIDSKSRYVLVGTGFSESSLGKMNVNNQEKQKRAFALSMAQMMKIEARGGKGRLVYMTTSPISDAYEQYLYRIYNQNNLKSLTSDEILKRYQSFKRRYISTAFLTPKGRDRTAEDPMQYLKGKRNAYRRIKLPNQLIPLIHDKYYPNTFVGFTAHFTGPYLEDMAHQFGLPYLANPSGEAHWIKKSMSRQSFRDAGVRHARGTYEPAFSVDALVNDIYVLLKEISGRKIIMKLDQSAAGYGNRVMRFDDITGDMTEEKAKELIRTRFDNEEDFPETFIKRIEEKDGGAIIEEFLDCKNYASPASIFMINGESNVTVHYTYDQLLGGKDNMVFQGSIGPIVMPGNEEGDIEAMSREVGMYLSTQGVRGNVGTDFVVCDDDTGTKRIAYAIENNVRMTGTSYPYYTVRTMLGEKLIKTKFMKSFDDVKVPEISLPDFVRTIDSDLFNTFLNNHPLNLNITTGVGCLVHNDTFKLGKLGIACVADTKDDVVKYYDDFVDAIRTYLDGHERVKLYNRYYH